MIAMRMRKLRWVALAVSIPLLNAFGCVLRQQLITARKIKSLWDVARTKSLGLTIPNDPS